LDKICKNEHDARVRERILLVIRISSDKQRIDSVARELHRSRSWAYKWYKRYNDEGLEEGMKDRPRSGKPSILSKETIDEIKQELSGSSTEWDFKQVMASSKRGRASSITRCTSTGCFTDGAFHRRCHRKGL
jgi:transposase